MKKNESSKADKTANAEEKEKGSGLEEEAEKEEGTGLEKGKDSSERISISIKKSLLVKIDKAAEAEDRSRSGYVVMVLKRSFR